ncbi:MAG TPA: hypothetical protein P5277_00160 [Candidatus Paceibacterota bacterium]|nr:hypothetical protein [Candidatus Paceibacterota bacterium]
MNKTELELKEPEKRKPMNLERIAFALILASLTFVLGFMISYTVSYTQYKSIQDLQDNMKYDLLSVQIEKSLVGNSCTLFNPYRFSSEMSDMGFTIDLLEKRFGKNDEKVIEKKKIYSLLEVQHFLYINDYRKNCNKSMHTILFFYSNEENDIGQGELFGRILNYVKTTNKNVMIYSFDYNLDDPLINTLKKKYNIIQPNTILIDENVKLTSIKNSEEVSFYIDK